VTLVRFSRAAAREVVDKLGIHVVKSDVHGIEIQREGQQSWLLYTGGGIAGNSDKIWLRPIGPRRAVRGPFGTRRDLEQALRAWQRGE
jgi:hypothetical protein